MATVQIYTTPTCGFCKMAKEYFKVHDVEYQETDVSISHDSAEEMVKKSGQLGVPVIDIDGKIIVGFNRQEIDKALGI